MPSQSFHPPDSGSGQGRLKVKTRQPHCLDKADSETGQGRLRVWTRQTPGLDKADSGSGQGRLRVRTRQTQDPDKADSMSGQGRLIRCSLLRLKRPLNHNIIPLATTSQTIRATLHITASSNQFLLIMCVFDRFDVCNCAS